MKMAAEDVTPCHSYLYFIMYNKMGSGLKALGKDLLLISSLEAAGGVSTFA